MYNHRYIYNHRILSIDIINQHFRIYKVQPRRNPTELRRQRSWWTKRWTVVARCWGTPGRGRFGMAGIDGIRWLLCLDILYSRISWCVWSCCYYWYYYYYYYYYFITIYYQYYYYYYISLVLVLSSSLFIYIYRFCIWYVLYMICIWYVYDMYMICK